MDKYVDLLSDLPFDILHVAQSYAMDNGAAQIEPAHLLRALLHKQAGLVDFIEDSLNSDYYYLVDWSDVRMQQCEKSPYKMKGIQLSQESRAVIKEAVRLGDGQISLQNLLAAIVTPGVAFSVEQLKTMPLTAECILKTASTSETSKKRDNRNAPAYTATMPDYCVPLLPTGSENRIVGFDREIRTLLEVLARKDRANMLIVGDPGVGKSSLIEALIQRIASGNVPDSLAYLKPYELDLITLGLGVSYKGEMEDRFKDVVARLQETERPVLVIKNFHRIEDQQSILNGILPVLKKALSGNSLQ